MPKLSRVLTAGALVSSLLLVDLSCAQARTNPEAVKAERLQARLRQYALANKPLSGARLANFLAGKTVGANQNYPDIPSFQFHAPGRVIVSSAQGLLREYALYDLQHDRFCVRGTRQRFGCFQVFVQPNSLPILKMGEEPTARYVLANVHK